MNLMCSTAPPAVEVNAARAAAERAVASVEAYAPGKPLRGFLLAYNTARASMNTAASEDAADALWSIYQGLWDRIVRADITCADDAAVKLALVARSFPDGERRDMTDLLMLQQVTAWLEGQR